MIYKAEGRGFDAELSELAEQATRSERTAWRVSAKSVNPEALEHGGPGIRTPKRSRAAVFKFSRAFCVWLRLVRSDHFS